MSELRVFYHPSLKGAHVVNEANVVLGCCGEDEPEKLNGCWKCPYNQDNRRCAPYDVCDVEGYDLEWLLGQGYKESGC